MPQDRVECSNCHSELSTITAGSEHRVPCPKCGYIEKTFYKHDTDAGRGFEIAELKQKRQGFKRPIKEVITGRRKDREGQIVDKHRVIDRLRNRYEEHVASEDGEVIVAKDGPLTEHT